MSLLTERGNWSSSARVTVLLSPSGRFVLLWQVGCDWDTPWLSYACRDCRYFAISECVPTFHRPNADEGASAEGLSGAPRFNLVVLELLPHNHSRYRCCRPQRGSWRAFLCVGVCVCVCVCVCVLCVAEHDSYRLKRLPRVSIYWY